MSKIELLNGDSYELIKTIPDKSIDLIYVDIPYLYDKHGCSKKSALSKRIDNVQNHQLAKIKDGIDYQILDEFCRVMKYIYIYMVFKRTNTRFNGIFCKRKTMFFQHIGMV